MKKYLLVALAGLALTSSAFARDSETVSTFQNKSNVSVCAVYTTQDGINQKLVPPGKSLEVKYDGDRNPHFAIEAQEVNRLHRCSSDFIRTPTQLQCSTSPQFAVVVGEETRRNKTDDLTLICENR